MTTRHVTFVIPVLNEAESLPLLFAEIEAVMAGLPEHWDAVFVDDGSTDGSLDIVQALADAHTHVSVVEFRRNFGKSAALDAGFREARGDVVITMDADLQDDPAEVPRMLATIDAGHDVVSGWKENRLDPYGKTLPSKLFNAVVRKASGLGLRDFNCGFKAYRAEAVRDLTLYGELHRFVPVILHFSGFKVGEIAVHHRARRFGQSKYGLERLFKGALDLLTVMMTYRFNTRPLHVFGAVGALLGLGGAAILAFLAVMWFVSPQPVGTRPLFFVGILMTISSVQVLTTGLLAELVQHQAARAEPSYSVRPAASRAVIDRAAEELRAMAAAKTEAA